MHGFGLPHRGNLLQLSQNIFWNAAIHVDHGNGFARLRRCFRAAPSQRKVRNIDFVFAQDRTYFADHSGNVAVSQVDQISFQRRFHIDVIDMQQAWRGAVQNGAFHHVLFG